ncbi:hypothetical protein [Haloarchaeobius sp. HRN-SO-5]|uniref:hypothetical protein n=1 Tax=Haloarchaeobius sp. HRN-SO-5 TaxID=3446118 RepID=UPI003EB84906
MTFQSELVSGFVSRSVLQLPVVIAGVGAVTASSLYLSVIAGAAVGLFVGTFVAVLVAVLATFVG